ncbi:ABC transporter ATP-binding protein [Mycobacterium sp. HM-7]
MHFLATPRFERLHVLWSFAAPHRTRLAIGLVLGLMASAAGLASPMITKVVLDSLGTKAPLILPVVALVGLLMFSAVIAYVESILLATVGERIVLDARKSLVHRFLRATVPAISSHRPGELVSRVTSDTVLLHEASASINGLINGTVMLTGTFVLMAVLDIPLLATTLVTVAVVAALFAALMPGIATDQQQAQHHLGKVGGLLEGTVRAIRTVKACRAEERQADQIIVEADASTHHAIRAARRESLAWTIATAGANLAIVVVLAVGAWRVSENAMALSSLIAFLLYAFGLIDPITELSHNVTTLQAGIAAAGRIRQAETITTESDTAAVSFESETPTGDAPVLEFRSVTAGYPSTSPTVRDVNLIVARCGHTAIVGPSGAGKTTMLALIMRFLEPEHGELLLNGRPYQAYTHADLRARMAFVEQDTPIVPGTIRDNLLYAFPDASEAELHAVLREVRLAEEIAELEHGLGTDLNSSAVSTGQRQRIALARALLQPSDVLLLDEATAHLDGLTETAIAACIRQRARKQAVITVAHRLSTVIDADNIMVMERGRIRAHGTHRDLIAGDEMYRSLVNAMNVADPTACPVGG